MVIYHSWIQDLFGGKRFQKFHVQEVSQTLARIWLQGMLADTEVGPAKSLPKSKNGIGSRHPQAQERGVQIDGK